MTTLITGNIANRPEVQLVLTDLVDAGFSKDQTAMFFVSSLASQEGEAADAEAHCIEAVSKEPSMPTRPIQPIHLLASPIALHFFGNEMSPEDAGASDTHVSRSRAAAQLEDGDAPHGANVITQSAPHHCSVAAMLVAVLTPDTARQDTALAILRSHGASNIERLDDSITNHGWSAVNPQIT